MGVNQKKERTSDPLINLFSKKISSWRNRFVSLGGQVVLLNSVLNSISSLVISFMKMLVLVWKKLVSLQRRFFKGGLKEVLRLRSLSGEMSVKSKG